MLIPVLYSKDITYTIFPFGNLNKTKTELQGRVYFKQNFNIAYSRIIDSLWSTCNNVHNPRIDQVKINQTQLEFWVRALQVFISLLLP